MGFSITGIVTPQPSAIKHGFKRQTQQHTHTPGTRTKLFYLTRFPPSAILTAITCGTISIKQQHLYLDRAHNPKSVERQITKRGYVPLIQSKRKRGR
jgi:hypothetical protein